MSNKRCICDSVNESNKKTRKSITLELKMEVLKRLEAGEHQVDVGRSLSLATSSIRTIIQNSEKIKTSSKCVTAITATKLTRSRSNLLEKMEIAKHMD
jgi:siderophore synthetase component